jgi:hypothetical protein
VAAKHGFFDLDATFSVAFISILTETIYPGEALGVKSLDGACAILQYLVDHGNKAAFHRRAEIDQMRSHLFERIPGRNGTLQEEPTLNPEENANHFPGISVTAQSKYLGAPQASRSYVHADS